MDPSWANLDPAFPLCRTGRKTSRQNSFQINGMGQIRDEIYTCMAKSRVTSRPGKHPFPPPVHINSPLIHVFLPRVTCHVFQLNVILYSQLSFNCNFSDKFLITSLPPKFIFEIKTIRISIFKIISMSKCKMVQNLLQELYRERHEPAIWRPQHEQNYTNKRRIVKILSQRGGWFESKNPKYKNKPQ